MTGFGTEGVREPSRGERARSASADVRVVGSPLGEVGADVAASGDQLELVPVQRCDHCGPLDWTTNRFGRITHKHACPHRVDVFCQAHPSMCGEPVRPVKNPDWPLTTLPGETWEDIFA